MGRRRTAHGRGLVPGGARGNTRGAGGADGHHARAGRQALDQGPRQRARPAPADHRPATVPGQRPDPGDPQHPRGRGQSPRNPRRPAGRRGARLPALRRERVLGRCPADGGALRALPGRLVPPLPRAVAGHQPARRARERGVHRGRRVSTPEKTVRPPTGLALLLALAALLVIASGVSYYFMQSRPAAAAAHAAPIEALYNLALDAGPAVAGDAGALEHFGQHQKQLEDAAARDPASPFTADARFTRLMSNAAAVARARGALADAGSAARETATLVPRLLSE